MSIVVLFLLATSCQTIITLVVNRHRIFLLSNTKSPHPCIQASKAIPIPIPVAEETRTSAIHLNTIKRISQYSVSLRHHNPDPRPMLILAGLNSKACLPPVYSLGPKNIDPTTARCSQTACSKPGADPRIELRTDPLKSHLRVPLSSGPHNYRTPSSVIHGGTLSLQVR